MENTNAFDFGMIGLGVMGRNFLLNLADHGFAVAGLDLDEAKVKTLAAEAKEGIRVSATQSDREFIAMLKKPRVIMMLVPAGKPVDAVVDGLLPYIESGDIIIDGGNSLFSDTNRRVAELAEKNIHFLGVGVSGGEKGARYGPSIMPGGNKEAYERVRPMFEAVAAKVNGEPCVTWLGENSAGNYVKMVHNGIEYGLMQLISEAYDVLKKGMGLNDEDIRTTFAAWDQGELKSFLLEITAEIFGYKDEITGDLLVNLISDRARQKGTGKWTSQNAMDLQVPLQTIDMAVTLRDTSAYKELRQEISGVYKNITDKSRSEVTITTEQLRKAFYTSSLITYAQGMAMLATADKEYTYDYKLSEIARIWRGGCIIRSACLEDIKNAFKINPALGNLLLDPQLSKKLTDYQADLRQTIVFAVNRGIPAAALMASVSYLDSFRSAKLPTNLIQAQRDYFGSHTYERIDQGGIFHTQWSGASTVKNPA